MAEFRVRVEMPAVAGGGRVIIGMAMPMLSQAVRAVMAQTAANWIEAVQRARLWSGEKDAYANSIQAQMTGDLTAVVWTDYRLAEEIESGRPAKDLKQMLSTSLKVRTTKKGKRYLVIPFRHNAPGGDAHAPAMPQSVYSMAKKLAASSVTGMGTRLSGTGASDIATRQPLTVPQRRYSWGDRLVGAAAMGGSKNHEGMYRFSTTTPGGKRSSAYMTFRVMVEGSPKWIVPPRPGLHIAQKVAQDMQPLAERAFAEAVRHSL